MTPSLGTSEWTRTSASESTAETKLQVSLTPQSHSYSYQRPSSLCYSSSLSPSFSLPPSSPSSSLSPFLLPPSSSLSPFLLPLSLPSSLLPLSVAGIAVIEHLEFNVVPLAVSLTSKFYQTMQDFFFPKAEGEGQGEGTDPDHAHLFGPGGVQRMCVWEGEGEGEGSLLFCLLPPYPSSATVSSGDSPDSSSPFLSRASSVRRSTLSVTSAATTASSTSGTLTSSPPTSPSPKEVSVG